VKRVSVTMMMNPFLKQQLQRLAHERGVKYQTLIQQYLLERVEQELRMAHAPSPTWERRPSRSSKD